MAAAGRGRKRKIINNNTIENGLEKTAKRQRVSHRSHNLVPGCVLTLGEGDVGQLGLGPDIMERTKPAKVNLPVSDIIQVCAGGMHTVCVTKNGEVYTFGCNDEGGLGHPTDEEGSESEPAKVELDAKVVMVSAGDSHTAALSDGGKVYIWGTFRDANGSIGLVPEGKICPAPIRILPDKTTVKIASGNDHLVCLTDDGQIYSLGNSEQGQLGRVAECFSNRGGRKGLELLLNITQVRNKRKSTVWTDVWTGQYVTYAQDSRGMIYTWGLNNYYQLGFSDMRNRFVPEIAKSFKSDKGWLQISGGQHHTLALDKDGKVYSLGRKEYGRLGLGDDAQEKAEPTLIPALKDKKCVFINSGTAVSFAVTDKGEIYGWGMGSSKQLATKEEDDLWEPVQLMGKQLEERSGIMVTAGGQHTVILAQDKK